MSATLSKLMELRDLIMDLRNAETQHDHEKSLRSALNHVSSLEHDACDLIGDLDQTRSINRAFVEYHWGFADRDEEDEDWDADDIDDQW